LTQCTALNDSHKQLQTIHNCKDFEPLKRLIKLAGPGPLTSKGSGT
jgi:hypothetical protein